MQILSVVSGGVVFEYLVVAGAGGGASAGNNSQRGAGAGGAGGYRTGTLDLIVGQS